MEYILIEKTHYSATIILNRPQKLNALNDEMLFEVRQALQDAQADPSVRVVVLKGAGRAFCAGFDVSADQKPKVTASDWNSHFSNAKETFMAIWDMAKPVIAQVQGHCLGGEFDMSMACDLTIAADNAKFGEPEVLFAGTCMFMLLPWLTSLKACKQILLTGESIGAQRALEMGLVSQVVPAEELEQTVQSLVKKMARMPLGTLPLNKKLINRTYELMNVREALTLSCDNAVNALLSKEGEALEFDQIVARDGLKAALQWRDQRFQ